MVDPRIAARRDAVAVDERRRRRLRLATVVVLAATVVGAVLATRTPLFDVDRIVVAGSEQTAPHDVVAASAIAHGDLLVEIDPSRASTGVEELPWVAAAVVSPRWPDSVVIEVLEREAAGVVTDGSVSLVVDGDGLVLDRRTGAPPGAIEVEGLPATEPGDQLGDGVRAALAVGDLLPEVVAAATESVRLRDGELQLVLSPRGVARMGDAEMLDHKVRVLETMLTRVELACLDTIDVRVPDAPVLTRDPGCDKVSTEIRG